MGSEQSLLSSSGSDKPSKFTCDNYECRVAREGDITTFSTIAECQSICAGSTDTKWYIGLILVLVFITVILLSVRGKFKKS